MESCLNRKQEEESLEQKEDLSDQTDQSGFVKEKCQRKGSLRVKIVLTKEELEWFMVQLQNKDGKSLEDVLEEIERGRGKVIDQGWKPSLESIMECPEVVEMDR